MSDMVAAKSNGESYVGRLKSSRTSPAVLKARLVTIRSKFPSALIFAFEGKDDKVIYYNWTKRVRSNISYEPFPCDGKKNVLELIEVAERDLNNIGENVYFFVDRDFDDNAALTRKRNVYVTEAYSIENYLVSSEVVVELLKNDFHCHGELEVRSEITKLFDKLYEEFLNATKEINFRVYFARRSGVQFLRQLPDKINQLAKVYAESVEPSGVPENQVIQLSREPNLEEENELRREFENLTPRERYRGKFAMMFFRKWLQCLVDERNNRKGSGCIFSAVQGNATANTITLDSLASKSEIPGCFIGFMERITNPG